VSKDAQFSTNQFLSRASKILIKPDSRVMTEMPMLMMQSRTTKRREMITSKLRKTLIKVKSPERIWKPRKLLSVLDS